MNAERQMRHQIVGLCVGHWLGTIKTFQLKSRDLICACAVGFLAISRILLGRLSSNLVCGVYGKYVIVCTSEIHVTRKIPTPASVCIMPCMQLPEVGAATKFLKPLPLLPLHWLVETATATSAAFSKSLNRYPLLRYSATATATTVLKSLMTSFQKKEAFSKNKTNV